MIIDLKQLEQGELHIVYDYPLAFQLNDPILEFRRAPSIDLTLSRTGAEIRTLGRLEAELSACCDRCRTNYQLPISTQFDLFFASETEIAVAGEYELGSEDLSCGFYRDDQIDLDGLVREQVELALPFRLLCCEDCQGLCPKCGADLNLESCHCPSGITDELWSGLQGLGSTKES